MTKPFRCHDADACRAGQSPCPTPWACGVEAPKKDGQAVMALIEFYPILKAIREAGIILIKTDSGYVVNPYFEMMGS